MPNDIQLDHELLQALQVNRDIEEDAEYEDDPWYPHPRYFGHPAPIPNYPPLWGAWGEGTVVVAPEVHSLVSGVANMSLRFRGR